MLTQQCRCIVVTDFAYDNPKNKWLFWTTSHSAILTSIDFSFVQGVQQAATQVTNYHFLVHL
jgi:hypothetical protein